MREVATAIRAAIPNGVPLFLRISGTEWLDGTSCAAKTGSWDLASSIQLATLLPEFGVDLVDVSSGGNHREQHIKPHGTYQVGLAGEIRKAIRAVGQNTLVGALGSSGILKQPAILFRRQTKKPLIRCNRKEM